MLPKRANEIARGKRALDEKYGELPPPPFRGWHARGYLPHCDKPGLLQMVTFRLGDAMPVSRRQEWEALRRTADERQRRIKLEAYLDRGYGACHLRKQEAARIVEDALLFHDAKRYRLCCWTIMPNHVHVILEQWNAPLEQVLYSWKRFSATRINRMLSLHGPLWESEYWDRYMRDEDHFRRARDYIEANPVKAGLCSLSAEWPWSSANPKWQWDLHGGGSRYHSGHLMSDAWRLFLENACGAA